MEFLSSDRRFGVMLTQTIITDLQYQCTKAGNKETGGIMIGRYSESLKGAVVSSITGPPPDSKAGKTWFERGVIGLRTILDRRFKESKTYYLGEWHFHPFATPTPSYQDRRQMKSIARDKKYNCPEPILLILGGNPSLITPSIKVFVFPMGDCVEMFQVS